MVFQTFVWGVNQQAFHLPLNLSHSSFVPSGSFCSKASMVMLAAKGGKGVLLPVNFLLPAPFLKDLTLLKILSWHCCAIECWAFRSSTVLPISSWSAREKTAAAASDPGMSQ